MPAISILTPVWNGLPYVKECVESVCAQNFKDWEWIIGDNGSTDGTREFLASLNDPRIRIIEHPQNVGVFGNLNLLFRKADSPLSFILCADDCFLPGGLARMIAKWEGLSSEIAYIRFNFGENRLSSALCRYSFDVALGEVTPEWSDLLFFVFGNLPGNLSNVAVRTDRVCEAGFFSESLPYAGDFEMWSRMGARWPFFITEVEVTYVRRHPGVASIYLNRQGELVAQQRQVVDELFARLEARVPGWLLKLYSAINYDTLQRDIAVKALLLRRQGDYLRCVNEAVAGSSALFPRPVCWLLYFFTGGGRWGRSFVARRVLAAAGR